jgi:hypothetical protein
MLTCTDWLQQTAQWAGIKSVISLERTRENKQTGKQEIDRQVYISSLPKVIDSRSILYLPRIDHQYNVLGLFLTLFY